MQRLPDWQERLTRYVTESASEGFKFGRLDGATFAAGAIHAMTGEDLLKGFRGYKTALGGVKKLRAAGYDDHVAFVEAHLEEADSPDAGNLALIDGPDGTCFGVCQGRQVYVITQETGLFTVSNTKIKKVFKV